MSRAEFHAKLAAVDFDCLDCGVDTLDEYYMVHDEIWLEANPADKGKLCIGCVEGRLGRRLTRVDFTDAKVNTRPEYTRSQRLQDRLAA